MLTGQSAIDLSDGPERLVAATSTTQSQGNIYRETGYLLYLDIADVVSSLSCVSLLPCQVSPGSHRRYLFPLGLCEGNHSVAAWAFDRNGILSSHVTSLIPTEKPPVGRHQGIPISVSTPTTHRSSASDHVDGSDELRRKRCDPSERQPPLLMGGRDRIGGDRTLCRVCAIDPLDSSDPVVQIRYGHEGGAVRPRCRSGKPRRLVLSTSLRVVTDTSGGEKGSSSHIWPIELWEGDSPASISRQFVATRLGMRVRPEGPTPPVIAEPQSSGDSFKFLVEDDEEGERTVQWLTQRLEIEISTRQVICGDLK